MQTQTIFIPQNDVAFNQFFKDINQYVTAKTAGTIPEWTHIPPADRSYLFQVYIDWYSSYVLTLDPHASQITRETKRIRIIAERVLDSFVNRFLRFEPVTDIDRASMGILNQAQCTNMEEKEAAEFGFNLQALCKVFVGFLNKGAAARKSRAAAFR